MKITCEEELLKKGFVKKQGRSRTYLFNAKTRQFGARCDGCGNLNVVSSQFYDSENSALEWKCDVCSTPSVTSTNRIFTAGRASAAKEA